jgi:alpha/beta superfamily hydrolase
MGGDRHHPLVVAVSEGLAAAGVAALRVDLHDPDVGTSVAALEQVAAGLLEEVDVDRLFLVGYSWGSVVTSSAAPARLSARVLVAPPVAMFDLPSSGDVPALVLVPAHDQYGGPDAVRAAMDGSGVATMEVVDGTDHFLAGAVGPIAERAVAWLTEQT